MAIVNLLTNRLTNPLGHALGDAPRLSWVVEADGECAKTSRVEVSMTPDFEKLAFDSGRRADIDSVCYPLPMKLAPRTRYYWRVSVVTDLGESLASDAAWFETGKLDEPWAAEWIAPDFNSEWHPVLLTEVPVDKQVASARVYACGLGLYELSLNGRKVGDEFLAPGLCAYDMWLPYQTYDVTDALKRGGNTLEAALGNGWYKGRYGLNRRQNFQYGHEFALILEMHIRYQNGDEQVVLSDASWQARRSSVIASGIFDGEHEDRTIDTSKTYPVKLVEIKKALLEARRSPATRVMHELRPVDILKTPKGETVLDMGQNMVGFLSFFCDAPKGSRIHIQFGEVLQDGNFYRDNLRTAKAEFIYESDGQAGWVRQQFTFFGFRYVKLTEWHSAVKIDNFRGLVLYSDMRDTGSVETDNRLVNKLFKNTYWGQRGNYLDTPTDCPQRDERMGWTGDSQVFFGTGAFNMDVAAFFGKYMHDMLMEQRKTGGWVPVVVPRHDVNQLGACAWGDAATIIPWSLYVRYGDLTALREQYPSMKGWVDALREHDHKGGDTRLWKGSFHYGDWLSLDVEDPIGYRFGGTERIYLASCFYLYSTRLLVKAARALGLHDDASAYENLQAEIHAAILREFLTPSGRLAVTTQTAYILALFMDIVPVKHREKTAYALRLKLKESNYHLRTGFIGTPYLNRVLSNTGNNDIAYKLLLQQDFPSWLYEVNMGATTIWERWNSILPDGSISDTGMNSLNHYAYGSIVEWLYRDVCGINPVESAPGFRKILLAPKPDRLLGSAKAIFDSPVGRIESGWKIDENLVQYRFVVPFGATAELQLPGEAVETLKPGVHEIAKIMPKDVLTLDSPLSAIHQNPAALEALREALPELPKMMLFEMMAGERCVNDYVQEGFLSADDPRLLELSKMLEAL